MKKLIVILLCMACVLSMVGCHKNRDRSSHSIQKIEESSEVAKDDEPLKLYYIENDYHQGVTMLLGWYRTQKGAVQVEATGFASAEELEKALEQEGYPDIIMLDKMTSSSSLDPFNWIREGNIAGLGDYMAEDESYESSNYIVGILEAGMYGSEQYILPLSVSNQYLMINEEELKTGTLSSLDGGYTMEHLMEELIRDAQLHEGETYFTHIPFGYDLAGICPWIYEMLELTGAMHVDRENKEVEVDEALFAKTMAYMEVLIADANLLYGGTVNMDHEDFVAIEEYCTVVLSDRNTPYMTRYMSSASHQLLEQEMTLLPYTLADGGYAVCINVMGMVGAESDQPEAAYRVLRTMMDVPKDKWEMINVGDTFAQMSPVNQNEALALVDSLAILDRGNFKVLGVMIQREPLTERQAETLRDMVRHNQRAYIVDKNISSAIESYVYPSLQTGDADWAEIAQQTADAIKTGMYDYGDTGS